jgi:heme O synthase-like polyprenyltransferase
MTTLITILALLFAALFILVSLTEKYGSRDEQQTRKLSRYIIPLLIALVAAQVIKFVFFPEGF